MYDRNGTRKGNAEVKKKKKVEVFSQFPRSVNCEERKKEKVRGLGNSSEKVIVKKHIKCTFCLCHSFALLLGHIN